MDLCLQIPRFLWKGTGNEYALVTTTTMGGSGGGGCDGGCGCGDGGGSEDGGGDDGEDITHADGGDGGGSTNIQSVRIFQHKTFSP